MSDNFTSSALIGHLVAVKLTAKLVQRNILAIADAHEIMDEALLLLESWQKAFPENDAAFEEARNSLEELVRFYGQNMN